MNACRTVARLTLAGLLACIPLGAALAQTATAGRPADPWPRGLSVANAAVLVYQPQINRWVDNQLDFRAAVAKD